MIWIPNRGQEFKAFQPLGKGEKHYHRAGLMFCTGRRTIRRGGGNSPGKNVFVISANEIELNELVWRFERGKAQCG